MWMLATLAWAGLIFWASSQPAGTGRLDVIDFPGLDKVAHFISFGIFAALSAQALRGFGDMWSLVLAVVLASAFGVSDELHQQITPGRNPSVLDWVADTLGAVVFVLGVWFLRR